MIARWWFAAVPAERLAAFRILVGAYCTLDLALRLPLLLAYARFPASEFHPVGVVHLIDRPLPPLLAQGIVVAALLLAIPFTLGVAYRVTAPLFAAALLWALCYRNSWSMPYHTENLQVLHVAILAFAPAADAWSVDARGRAAPAPDGRYAWALRAAAVVTILTYVLAGIAKLRIAGAGWLDGDQLRNQIAYDNLRRAVLGASPSALATPLLEHAWVFQGLAWLTMLVELGAPIALLHRRLAVAWAVTAWGFHVGVVVLMHIVFPYPLVGLAYAPLFALERPLGAIARRYRARRSRGRPAAR